MFKTLIVPAIAGLAILAAPATALAGETNSGTIVRVAVGDLNLATDQGATEMKKRVRSATYQACLYAENGQLVSPEEQTACVRTAQAKAKTQMAQKIANSRFGG
ncbi:UrcA family protein [Croceicoccus ponticola]|uniref:UrcA family protein n=1 Tax=Croceicoccus ponticola TaxID=2217664 RepID=A0A437GYJ4_9SPHN|nr:UrcA family protein [Croceicoccus ponticola]RVQ67747.1 UrcA family protein [Croceicoccus ponticola]